MQEIAALLSDPSAWAALAAMVVLEVVLGIDNLIFISILTNKLPAADQPRARFIGMSLAVLLRLVLLAGVAWIYDLTEPLFMMIGHAFSWRDLILIAGGLFLIWKATVRAHPQGLHLRGDGLRRADRGAEHDGAAPPPSHGSRPRSRARPWPSQAALAVLGSRS